jgi:peptidoglycan/LPS O-acetylase OafA/YrhL
MRAARFEALDAWRGICALVVALEHFSIDNPLHDNRLVHNGYRFVDFFFVLSGFVIAHAYRDRLTQGWSACREFMIRRLGRLWPLHAVMLVAFFCFELSVLLGDRAGFPTGREAFTERTTLVTLPANLWLVHGWGWLDTLTWNGPSWSISTELAAYTAFALLCASLPRRVHVPVAGAIVVIAASVLVLVAPELMKSTFDFGLVRCLFGFMTGVLVYAAHTRRQLRVGTFGEIVCVIGVVGGVVLLPYDESSLLVTPLFALAVWVFAAEDGAVSRWLRASVPQALGAWSYSIYMVHAFVALVLLAGALVATKFGVNAYARIDGTPMIVGAAPVTTAILIGYLAVVLALARITYRRIELAGQRWAARLAGTSR